MKSMARSLFARTALTLALAFVVFQAAAFWVVYRTLIVPVAERSADDLAAFIVTAVETWEALPATARPTLEYDLETRQGLVMHADMPPLARASVYLPYVYFLRNSLISDQLFSLALILLFNWESAARQAPAFSWRPAAAA